jgi:hypothetical protein
VAHKSYTWLTKPAFKNSMYAVYTHKRLAVNSTLRDIVNITDTILLQLDE